MSRRPWRQAAAGIGHDTPDNIAPYCSCSNFTTLSASTWRFVSYSLRAFCPIIRIFFVKVHKFCKLLKNKVHIRSGGGKIKTAKLDRWSTLIVGRGSRDVNTQM
nr:MAG TPA: hypothetical protein [Caudoviricetes sp.]